MAEALDGLVPGDEVLVLTWLDRADRDVLSVHPRDDESRPMQGVFGTRSPHRPNPIGLHRVEILAMDGTRVQVRNLEALDGTPIVDVKPILSADAARPLNRASRPRSRSRRWAATFELQRAAANQAADSLRKSTTSRAQRSGSSAYTKWPAPSTIASFEPGISLLNR